MTWFLRLFDGYRRLEKELDGLRFEMRFWRTKAQEFEAKLGTAKDDHIKDLRKVSDSESRRMTGRNIFSAAGQRSSEEFGGMVQRPDGPRQRRQALHQQELDLPNQLKQFYGKKGDAA